VELIVVILFFSLCVLLSVQLFTQAQVKSLRSERENHALLRAQSAVECLYQYDPQNMSLPERLDGCTADGQIYYDKDWTVVSSGENAAYQMSVTAQPEQTAAGQLVTVDVRVVHLRTGEHADELVTLTTNYYLPRG
jgi:Tfp pilus assembly protein PilE